MCALTCVCVLCALCTLHALVEVQHVGVGAHAQAVEVEHAQAAHVGGARQRHVRLAALEDTRQRQLHAVQRHALKTRARVSNQCVGQNKIS